MGCGSSIVLFGSDPCGSDFWRHRPGFAPRTPRPPYLLADILFEVGSTVWTFPPYNCAVISHSSLVKGNIPVSLWVPPTGDFGMKIFQANELGTFADVRVAYRAG